MTKFVKDHTGREILVADDFPEELFAPLEPVEPVQPTTQLASLLNTPKLVCEVGDGQAVKPVGQVDSYRVTGDSIRLICRVSLHEQVLLLSLVGKPTKVILKALSGTGEQLAVYASKVVCFESCSAAKHGDVVVLRFSS